jgi:hypothetical protein
MFGMIPLHLRIILLQNFIRSTSTPECLRRLTRKLQLALEMSVFVREDMFIVSFGVYMFIVNNKSYIIIFCQYKISNVTLSQESSKSLHINSLS